MAAGRLRLGATRLLKNLSKRTKDKFDFSKVATVDDVLATAAEIEAQQRKTKTLRGLARIQPLIKLLQEYSGVIGTFVQVKADVLGLIWGPLKFLLQAASSITAAFEKIVKALGDVGRVLPSFGEYSKLFPQNDDIRRVLCLFFEDILGLYGVLLDFAHKSSLSAHKGPKRVAIRTKKLHLLNNNEDQKRSLLLPGRERVSEPSSPPLFWDKLRTQQNDGHVSITVDALPHGVSDDSVSQHRFPTLGGVTLTYG